MNARTDTGPTGADALDDAAAVLAGLGMFTLVLFPLALPGIILLSVALVPVLLLAIVAAVIGAPILAVRALRRRTRSRRDDVAERGSATAAPAVRVARP